MKDQKQDEPEIIDTTEEEEEELENQVIDEHLRIFKKIKKAYHTKNPTAAGLNIEVAAILTQSVIQLLFQIENEPSLPGENFFIDPEHGQPVMQTIPLDIMEDYEETTGKQMSGKGLDSEKMDKVHEILKEKELKKDAEKK